MAIAGFLIFSIAWLLVFTGLQDALGPINRRLKNHEKETIGTRSGLRSSVAPRHWTPVLDPGAGPRRWTKVHHLHS